MCHCGCIHLLNFLSWFYSEFFAVQSIYLANTSKQMQLSLRYYMETWLNTAQTQKYQRFRHNTRHWHTICLLLIVKMCDLFVTLLR